MYIVYHVCALFSAETRKGHPIPGIGITEVLSCHVGAEKFTLVLFKSPISFSNCQLRTLIKQQVCTTMVAKQQKHKINIHPASY